MIITNNNNKSNSLPRYGQEKKSIPKMDVPMGFGPFYVLVGNVNRMKQSPYIF
jgi:hypothetical protein